VVHISKYKCGTCTCHDKILTLQAFISILKHQAGTGELYEKLSIYLK